MDKVGVRRQRSVNRGKKKVSEEDTSKMEISEGGMEHVK